MCITELQMQIFCMLISLCLVIKMYNIVCIVSGDTEVDNFHALDSNYELTCGLMLFVFNV